MSASIDRAQSLMSEGLQGLSSAISSDQAEEISRAFFPQLDGAVRLVIDGKHDSTKLAEAGLDYARGMFELKKDNAPPSDIKILRDKASVAMNKAGLDPNELDFDAVDGAIDDVLPKPPKPSAGVQDAKTLDNGEIAENAESQADNSSELSSAKLKEQVQNSLDPAIEKIQEALNENDLELFHELFKIFDSFPGEKGEVNSNDLKTLKRDLLEIMSDYDADKLKAFMTKLDPALQFEISSYMKNVVFPILQGGHGIRIKSNVDKKVQAPLLKSLEKFEAKLESRPEAAQVEDVSLIKDKRDAICNKLEQIAHTASSRLEQNSKYDVQAYIDQEIGKLANTDGDVVMKIYKDDIQVITKHLKNTENVSQKEQSDDLKNFIDKYGKYALMALPVVLGPVATMLSYIPIVGKPLASLAPMINSLASQYGVGLMSAAAVTMSTNGKQNAQAKGNMTVAA